MENEEKVISEETEKTVSEENTEEKGKKKPFPVWLKKVLSAAGVIALMGIAFWIGTGINGNKAPSESEGGDKINIDDGKKVVLDRDYSEIEEAESIAIPGYEKLSFKAGKTTQTVTLHNPTENTAGFIMSLVLEDGTVVWKSSLLEPGAAFTEIELSKTLEKGTYTNALLKYDCYSMKTGEQLNGSEIKLNIEVK